VHKLCETPTDTHVTSLAWAQQAGPSSSLLAVGTSDHKVQLWDVEKQRQVRSMDGHSARVSSLAWNRNLLSSGGRDSLIVHHDVRVAEHRCGTLKGHAQEVCGLRWSP
jgi:cell division cycle protein 20 (cofactor of APC complex)